MPQTPTIDDPPPSDREVKQTISLFSLSNDLKESKLLETLARFLYWTKLKKSVTRCIRCQTRFLRARRKKAGLEEHSYDKFITVEKMNIAEKVILKCLQNESFRDEVETLGKDGNKFVKKSSSLRKLDPFLDDGLIRVGGQFNRAPLPPDAKNLIIIPKRSTITSLLIEHCHNMLRHSGREHVLAYSWQ